MCPIGQLLLVGRPGEAAIGHLIKPSRPLSRFFHALSSPGHLLGLWLYATYGTLRYTLDLRVRRAREEGVYHPQHGARSSPLSVPFSLSLPLEAD